MTHYQGEGKGCTPSARVTYQASSKTSRNERRDPVEDIIQSALEAVGIPFVGGDNVLANGLDFYLINQDVHIEVKQFHSERISEQMSRASNVIAIQGMNSARLFASLIESGGRTPQTTTCPTCQGTKQINPTDFVIIDCPDCVQSHLVSDSKGSAAERPPSDQAGVSAEAWGRANLWLQVNWYDPSETQTTQSFMSAAGIEKRLAILPSVIAERSLHSKVTVTIRVFPMLPEMLQKQSQIEKRAHASADEAQRAGRLPDTNIQDTD